VTSTRRLLLALSLAAAVLAGCGKKKAEKKEVARDVTGLAAVPAGASAVVGLDVTRLTSSELVARAVEQLLDRRPELAQRVASLEEACHLDVARNLTHVILASGPRAANGAQPVLLVATGHLVEADLTACLTKQVGAGGGSVTATTTGGRTVYQVKDGRRTVYYAFGQADTVVLSNDTAWLDKALGTGPKVLDDADMKAWIGMSDQTAPAWLAARVDPRVGAGLVRVGRGAIGAGPKAVFGSLDPGGGVSAELGAVMASDGDAKALESLATSQMGLMALAAQWKGLGPVVGATKVSRDGPVLRLRLALSPDQVKQVVSVIDTVPKGQQDAQPGTGGHAP